MEVAIGEYVDVAWLLAHGGKFYAIGGASYCDTPTMTFVLEPQRGFKRIE